MNNRLTVVDLFSGAGGLMLGFREAGFKPLLSIENWTPAIETHKINYPNIPIIGKNIENIKKNDLLRVVGKDHVSVIIGGPPCQGFSTIGKRLKKDPRNKLVFEFIRMVKILEPDFFLMENVRGLLSNKEFNVREKIINEFKKVGYKNVISDILCAVDYEVPQVRYRLFFLGTKFESISLSFPEKISIKASHLTVGKNIMDLVGKENAFPNHVPMVHNEIVTNRISYIKEGEGIDQKNIPLKYLYGSRSDYKNNKLKNFSHVYKRLHRNKPSTTMVPGHNAFPLHPTLNRSLTVREAARLQTFPDNIVFKGTRQEQCIQVGNAVPVKLAYHLANKIKYFME